MFTGLEQGHFAPAAVIDHFTDEEEHKKVAELFNTTLVNIETKDERSKAFHDIIYDVKSLGYERQMRDLKPDDPDYLRKTIDGKKLLEEIAHTKISPDD